MLRIRWTGRACRWGGGVSAEVPVPSGAASIAVPPAPLSAGNGLDSETALVIIKQQARRIDELERANASLLDKLNKGLATVKTDGTYAQIYKKWFTSAIPPKGINLYFPETPAIKEAFAHPNDKGVE